MSTYDVRFWDIREYKGKRKTSYRVRWAVAGEEFGKSFVTKPLAESFRSGLITAAREGQPFDEASGLPERMVREQNSRTWYVHACEFVDMKWPRASGKHRKGIAESLATVTEALLATDRGAPSREDIRGALYGWAFKASERASGPPPVAHEATVRWLTENTVRLSAMVDPAVMRKALDALLLKIDGTAAAASTVARKRVVFYGALAYAVELGRLPTHPLHGVKWIAPQNDDEVDRRVVANPTQAERLLAGVREDTPELEGFFAGMYYSGLRPEELLHVLDAHCELPDQGNPDAWGWWHLSGATVAVGEGWTDDGAAHESRQLKHRGKKSTRRVPIPPEGVAVLRRHREQFRPGRDGRMFVTRRGPGGRYFETWPGTTIPNNSYTTVWARVRESVLTKVEAASPLAGRPYDLRHACLSLWLNAGVAPTQVAEWAGNSVRVLLKVYAKCIDGQEELALRRIRAALTNWPQEN
ncbi:tyrosine recombinase XerC [Catellatospora coxensis]|uniref:Integrase n=1 Tax=Catellatospora coxensis TaxID=310354 RepID=A0A8J3PBY6_9ACTN|nr:integrase [Catellatospora coxensis]GIG11074.1 integrase [Catellatospora coxensis]